MPLYEYRCKACGHVFEKIQSFSAPELKECPVSVCKGEVERLLSAPAVQFKGAGWYVTDYAGKSAAGKAGSANGSSSTSESSSSSKSESAPAAPAASSASGSSGGSSSSSSGSATS